MKYFAIRTAFMVTIFLLICTSVRAETLGGTVWLDMNGNQIQDVNEPGLNGVTVEVFDFTFSPVAFATTGSDGQYQIDVPAGDYIVFLDEFGLPHRVDPTYDYDGTTSPFEVELSLTAGENLYGVDFGFRGRNTIGDLIWTDQDGDGAKGATEIGLAGIAIHLTYAGHDGTVGTADDMHFPAHVTDSFGSYVFRGLPSGLFRVDADEATLPAGMMLTTANEPMDLRVGFPELGIVNDYVLADFGYWSTTPAASDVGDEVWLDTDADGVRDAGEAGIEGASVILRDRAGVVIASVATDVAGSYTFGNLTGGDFTIEVDPATLPAGLSPTYDVDGVESAFSSAIELAAGESRSDADFGFAGCGACQGKISQLTLQYVGNEASVPVVVEAKRGPQTNEVFSATVLQNDTFTLIGPASGNGGFAGTLGTVIHLYVDGGLNTSIHTSCSVPVGPGLVSGDFLVVTGESKDGGLLCPDASNLEPGATCTPLIDFDNDDSGFSLVPGEEAALQYADAGIHISTSDQTHTATVLDSSAPASGQADLGTPHESFQGPGVGTGGAFGAAGQNNEPLGNVLIVSEGGDPDHPESCTHGGTVVFDFDLPANVDSIQILDVDEVGGSVRCFDRDGNLLSDKHLNTLGDNSVQDVAIDATGVARMEITFAGSGALSKVAMTCEPEAPQNPQTPQAATGTGTPGYWKNHPEAWPTPALTLGAVTYTPSEAIALMDASGGGDKTYNMFEHLTAAMLNVANGTDPSCIEATISAADAWMTSNPVGSNVRGKDSAWKNEGSGLFQTLVEYNEGELCAPHRG